MSLNNSGKELADRISTPAKLCLCKLSRAGNFHDDKKARLFSLVLPNKRSPKNSKQIWELKYKLISLHLTEGVLKGIFIDLDQTGSNLKTLTEQNVYRKLVKNAHKILWGSYFAGLNFYKLGFLKLGKLVSEQYSISGNYIKPLQVSPSAGNACVMKGQRFIVEISQIPQKKYPLRKEFCNKRRQGLSARQVRVFLQWPSNLGTWIPCSVKNINQVWRKRVKSEYVSKSSKSI